MDKNELTMKEQTAICLYGHGCYGKIENLIGSQFYAHPNWDRRYISLGWTHHLFELGLIYSASNTFGLESAWSLTPEGEALFKTFTPREIYQAKNRLRRMGYHFTDDLIAELANNPF